MPEYNIGFSKVLIDAANIIINIENDDTLNSQRAALYLCKLSCEITLKASLEKAGRRIAEIRAYSHNLEALGNAVGKCEIEKEIMKGRPTWISASDFFGTEVDKRMVDVKTNATIGTMLASEKHGSSKYPNEIRYGESIRDYPLELWLNTAKELFSWADKNYDKIRLASKF